MSREPAIGDVWRSRDKRDDGLTVTVLDLEGGDEGFVWIKRFRRSRVRKRLFHGQYEFVREGGGRQ